MDFKKDDFIPSPRQDFDDDSFAKLIRDHNHADWQYEVLMKSIQSFEKNLNDDEEIALYLASFGQSVLMNITDIGYSNPSLIHFYGYVNGIESELIQHVSQINFLLTSSKKDDPNRATRRIGFITQE